MLNIILKKKFELPNFFFIKGKRETINKLIQPRMTSETTTVNKPTIGATGRKIIYDEDGKPCRSCNTLLDFQMATGKLPISASSSSSKQTPKTIPTPASNPIEDEYKQDPPDVELLGRSSWTFIHSLCAKYPTKPSNEDKEQISSFFKMLGRMYPCDWCAKDFTKYLQEHQLDNSSNEGLNMWLCGAHNAVNKKIGKKEFDCQLWKKRWKDGWD